jgi:hypothetical protein
MQRELGTIIQVNVPVDNTVISVILDVISVWAIHPKPSQDG